MGIGWAEASHVGQGLIAVAVCLALVHPAWSDDVPSIAAAADLKFALAEIARRFGKEHGRGLKLSFGSSGNFAHQIEKDKNSNGTSGHCCPVK